VKADCKKRDLRKKQKGDFFRDEEGRGKKETYESLLDATGWKEKKKKPRGEEVRKGASRRADHRARRRKWENIIKKKRGRHPRKLKEDHQIKRGKTSSWGKRRVAKSTKGGKR